MDDADVDGIRRVDDETQSRETETNMPVQETLIFIERPITEVVRGYRLGDRPRRIRSNDEVAFLFGGGAEDAEFGLTADLATPEGCNWTHLLHRNPNDIYAVAPVLYSLRIEQDEVHAATDWEGKSLVDLKPIFRVFEAIKEEEAQSQISRRVRTANRFEIYKDKKGETRFRYRAANGEIVFSSEGYKAKASALKSIESLKKNLPKAGVNEIKTSPKKTAGKPTAKRVATASGTTRSRVSAARKTAK